jgi:hypothetical protein
MAVITIGNDVSDRASARNCNGTTYIDANVAANGTGTLDTFELWLSAESFHDFYIGTFYGSSTSWTNRDYENLGVVAYGSKQTFTGKNCDVETGDCLGMYSISNTIEYTASGAGRLYKSGSQFGAGTQTYTASTSHTFSIGATGTTAAAGNPYYYYLQQ